MKPAAPRPTARAAAAASGKADTRRSRRQRDRAEPRPAGGTSVGRFRWALLLALLGVGILSRARYFDWCVHDDAFISFRYARNLARGAGLVMNPGERVEGISNFLWTLLSTPVLQAGLDPARCAQWLGAVCSLGLVFGLFLFSERRLGGGWYSLVAPVFLIGNVAFIMESLSGLETMAFALLVFAAYVSFLEERRGTLRQPGLWASWCGIATLVRPEGPLLFATLAGYAALGIRDREARARLARAALVYGALVVPFLIWRLAYYGSPVPNTFYAKVGYTMAQLDRGWRFTAATLGCLTWPFLVTLLILTAAAIGPWSMRFGVGNSGGAGKPGARDTSGFRRDALRVAALLAAVYVLYVMAIGGDYEPTGRFYMPVLGLLYLLFQEALRTLVLLLRGTRLRPAAALATLLLFAFSAYRSEVRFLQVLTLRGWPYTRFEHHRQLRAAGEWLRDHTPPQSVVALSSIGALPYFADRPVVDMMGLTDRHIARRHMPNMGVGAAGHEKGDGEYVLSRRPDIILFDKGYLFPQPKDRDAVVREARGVSELDLAGSRLFASLYELRHATTSAGVLHYFARRAAPSPSPAP